MMGRRPSPTGSSSSRAIPLLRLVLLICCIPFLASGFVNPAPATLNFASTAKEQQQQQQRLFRTLVAASRSADPDVCTVQILMSDTGGGHRASANAIRDAFDVLYPGKFECDIVDIYSEYGPFWPLNAYPAMYKIMAKYSFLWDYFYHFGETDFGLWLNEFLLDLLCFEPFKQCLNRPSGSTNKRADMVVSVHPLCQDTPLKIIADLDSNGKSRDADARQTPFVTVVTDLGGAHKTWFNKDVDKCFVPSDALNQKAQSRGLDPTQIIQYGLPIRKGFWSKPEAKSQPKQEKKGKNILNIFGGGGGGGASASSSSSSSSAVKDSLRSELGLDQDLPAVLVVGGGDGMGGIVQIATALGQSLGASSDTPAYQMVVVCGSNEEAKTTLSNQSWGPGVKVLVQGFVNNMDEWMNASDALVTKAGPGTIAEASICGLPCMLFAYLPGQEEGNVPYVEDSGFGKYSDKPEVIAETVTSWLSSPERMQSMKDAALEASRPSATLDIAKDLAEIAFANKMTKSGEKVLVRSR